MISGPESSLSGPGSSQDNQKKTWNPRNYSARLTENIGLPLTLLEKQNTWPAYVTFISPAVTRLTEKSWARDLECIYAAEKNHKPMRSSKPSAVQLKRRKSSKPSELMLKDALSETLLPVWECSTTNVSPIFVPESAQLQMEAREGPTPNYNKIIFSKMPAMRKLPFGSLQASKETHTKV
ncbi:CMT1A duplicated region transcript 4 protein [Arvicanthis niloticus]|uniref:CMT1A duplicated region transcript 4 protein n=1 Tax=Arvicanthis niloticus TaxID=61156 RepID=UPI0014872617|nr:CMT1A duplicated region transcript 4 protein [Arvicanthis niloticus]